MVINEGGAQRKKGAFVQHRPLTDCAALWPCFALDIRPSSYYIMIGRNARRARVT